MWWPTLSLVVGIGCSPDGFWVSEWAEPESHSAVEDTASDVPNDVDGDGDGWGGEAGNQDAGPQEDSCELARRSLPGSWEATSQLDMSDAIPSWVDVLADSARYACSWAGSNPISLGLPQWIPDLVCVAADLGRRVQDINVEHDLEIVDRGGDRWEVRDVWTHVTFEPDGAAEVARMEDLACPFDPHAFEMAIEHCDGSVSLEDQEVQMPVNGFVNLALDLIACQAMGHSFGCSWDMALGQICGGVDWTLAWVCADIVSSLRPPDPCISILPLELWGEASLGADGRTMDGPRYGRLAGGGFEGSFAARKD